MNLKQLAEPFPADQIEWRIGQSGKGKKGVWAMCLAYVQSRAIMDRLDEICGPENWKVEYRFISKVEGMTPGVIATLSVKIGGEWVSKEDGAEQTEFEPFKGGISGALKRAAVLFGVGRYLYDLEAGFAEISMEKKPGYSYAKTKDGTEFYWAPPALPSWALPAGTPKAPAAKSPAPKEPEAKAPPKQPTRKQIVSELDKAVKTLGLSNDDVAKWVFEDFNGKSAKDLTDTEMAEFLKTLQCEIGRRGEVA